MLPSKPSTSLVEPFADVDWHYARAIAARGDTYAHLPTLRALIAQRAFVDEETRDFRRMHVVEFGVRDVCTTWAFLAARPASLVSVDIADPPPNVLAEAERCAAEIGVYFEFVRASTLDLPPVACELLFVDTLHTYAQLRAELERHAAGVRRYIAFHDTISFGFRGEDGTEPGLQAAIEDLVEGRIAGSGAWRLRWHDEGCNGLAVVERSE